MINKLIKNDILSGKYNEYFKKDLKIALPNTVVHLSDHDTGHTAILFFYFRLLLAYFWNIQGNGVFHIFFHVLK